jgi:hypothetical protein
MEQKELKQKYMNIICTEVWPDSKKMQDYASKKANYIVELDNNDIYVIDKPRIETSFCFGFGMYGADMTNDQERAEHCAHNAATNRDYFMQENLKDIERKLEQLRDSDYEGYKYCAYSGMNNDSKLKSYTLCKYWDNPEQQPYKWNRLVALEKMTQEERDALIKGFETVKEMFTKRLNTYLKKYGLSKINTWTYLRD